MKILLPANMARAGWEVASARTDIETSPFEPGMPASDFRALLGEAHGVALGVTPFTEAELLAAPNLRAVARIGVGYDNVDVNALTRRKIPLMVTGTANSPSVAEQALFFMLALAKRHTDMHAIVHERRWQDRFGQLPFDLYGKTVLVIGFGRIGTRLASACLALGMTVHIHDPYVANEAIAAAGCVAMPDLDAALKQADFVSIHCPKSSETTGMFNATRITKMKSSAFLINTARGGIVDETALYSALTQGGIAGAGLDVFDAEPPPPDNPLPGLPNVITAPHIAGVTVEAFDRMASATVQNILDVLDGKPNIDHVINKEVI